MLRQGSPATRTWIAWLVVMVPLVLIVAAVGYSAAALPGCGSCHQERRVAAATAASAHAKVSCAACHVPSRPADRIAFGFREVFHMALPIPSGTVREWASVPNERCLSCHASIERGRTSAKGLTIVHSSCAKDAACTDCHSGTAHGKETSWLRAYDMETCLACHVKTAKSACDTCHSGRGKEERIASGVFATTHGPNWKQTHGMGNSATCTACHTAAKCSKCHGAGLPHEKDFVTSHPAVAKSRAARCSSCHETAFCDDCHGVKMPHSSEFTRGHAQFAAGERKVCNRCHAGSDCQRCHESHVHPGGSVTPTAPLKPWKSGS